MNRDWSAATDQEVACYFAALTPAREAKKEIVKQLTALSITKPANRVHAANMRRQADMCLDELLRIWG